MGRHVTIQVTAQQDLSEQAVHLGLESTSASERYQRAVAVAIETLAERPSLGRLREFATDSLAGIRSLPVPGFRNYLIFYRIQGDQLEIIRVLHGARDLESILEEGAGPEDSSS